MAPPFGTSSNVYVHKCECVCDCWRACGGGFSVEPCYFQITVLEVQTIPSKNRIKPE